MLSSSRWTGIKSYFKAQILKYFTVRGLKSLNLSVIMAFYWLLGFQRSSAFRLHVWLGQSAAGSGGHRSVSAVHTRTTLQVHSQMTLLSLKIIIIHLYTFVTAAWCGGAQLQKHVTLILPSCLITRASLSSSTSFGQWTFPWMGSASTDALVRLICALLVCSYDELLHQSAQDLQPKHLVSFLLKLR